MKEGEPKRICLFGPQGSGKGTQAERLSSWLGIPQIAPGNIFRQAVAEHSALGTQVEPILAAGQLVPDHITNSLMQQRIQQEDCLSGFVFDGYPRNTAQADALDAMTSLSHVIVIEIPDEESIRRISQRRVCTPCGITYHPEWKPPVQDERCDVCGGALIQRDDDTPEAIQKRLQIYRSTTVSLFPRYEQRGILHHVDGLGSIDEVWQRVQACF